MRVDGCQGPDQQRRVRTYANVGALYLQNLANGLDRADAWDTAAKEIGEPRGMSLREVLTITNPIGQMHAKAIKACAN